MMNSELQYRQAFVWIWLPGEIEPVVAGKLSREGRNIVFNYGKSYLERDNAISIYNPELPLHSGLIQPLNGLTMPNCIRDAAPDAWGRRVIVNRLTGSKSGAGEGVDQLDELTYLLKSGSDRIGALDFQQSAKEYVPRSPVSATLEELLESVQRVEQGVPLSPELDQALFHGSSIGGARPKVNIEADAKKYIAKFASGSDIYSVVKAEYIAMRLAAVCGLSVAPVSLTKASKKDVLLIERFDREACGSCWIRKPMVSGLTLLELDEMMARYASYEDLAEKIRYRFYDASATLKELFSRMVFNILCGNTDDHARNHAAFWDGEMLTLTPAYDICPQARTGNEATQAMLICADNRMSKLTNCLACAHNFLLSQHQAREMIEHQLSAIKENWAAVCDEAELSPVDRQYFWQRQFLNPFIFEGF